MKSLEDCGLPSQKRGLTISTLDDEMLVFDPTTTRTTCLNAFAAEVFSRCDGKRSAAAIARELPFANVDERVVAVALADLAKAELLEGDVEVKARVTGHSRRDLLRHIGLGAAAAVPVVTTITLPTPAQAITPGAKCTISNGDPCSSIGLCCLPRGNPQGGNNSCFNQGSDCVCQECQ